MKYVMIVMISAVAALAQQSSNCVVQGRMITLDDRLKLTQSRLQTAATEMALDAARKKYNDAHPEVQALQLKLGELRTQQRQLTNFRIHGLNTCRGDRWWDNPSTARDVGLSADQIKRMDDVFTQYRLKLIDLNGALEKEEIVMEPLVSAEQIDEGKIATQIDRVAQARAELEKANGRMLLAIRKQLTPEQWTKLNQH